MKKTTLFAILVTVTILFTSCRKNDYKSFIGTWGVERIDYYNIDYAGNPISNTMEIYHFVPGDAESGLDLVFREDQTGEMRDREQDTVKKFTYSYDERLSILYMSMKDSVDFSYRIYEMNIKDFTSNSFIYENEYKLDYVEKAYLKRLSNTVADKSTHRQKAGLPRHKGSFLSNK